MSSLVGVISFFCNDTATTEIYTLSLHDALPISRRGQAIVAHARAQDTACPQTAGLRRVSGLWTSCILDRKSTRLNSSHRCISYAVFCLKKKNTCQSKRAYYVGLHFDPLHSCGHR